MIYNLEIAIPSYNRPSLLLTKTLKLLSDIPKEYIKIYLEDESQLELYKEIEGYEFVLTHTKGIGNKRNFIKKHTNKEWLFQIDDDITAIIDYDKHQLTSREVFDVIIRGFQETEKVGLRLWGINPYDNSFFMKPTISTHLKFICGNFHGIIMKNTLILSTINTFEDYYITCTHFIEDGGVLRLNAFGTRTNFATNKGGLQSFFEVGERVKEERMNASILQNLFPFGMIKQYEKKRGIDIRLNSHFHCENY